MTEFDKLFQDNLKDGTEKPPSFVWDNIENEIDPKPKRKKFFLFWFLGGLSVLLSAILIYWMGSDNPIAASDPTQLNQKDQGLGIVDIHQPVLIENPSNLYRLGKRNQESKEEGGMEASEVVVAKGNQESKEDSGMEASEAAVAKGNQESKEEGGMEVSEAVVGKGNQESKEEGGMEASEAVVRKRNQESKEEGGMEVSEAVVRKRNQESKEEGGMEVSEAVVAKGNQESKEEGGMEVSDVSVEKENKEVEMSKEKSHLKDSILLVDKVKAVLFVMNSTGIEDEDVKVLLAADTTIKKAAEKIKAENFFVEARMGYSNYEMSLWNSSFVFGDLSKRKFKSTGFNINVTGGYQIKSWLNPIVGLNYNNKQAEFNYSALYDDQGFLNHNINGNDISLDEINDVDSFCNQYVLSDIKAAFDVQSFSLALGNRFNVLQQKRIGIDLDLTYHLELISMVNVHSIAKIDVSNNLMEAFNSKVAAGLNINYQLNKQLKLFVHAEYIFKPYNANNFHRSHTHEFISSIGARLHF